MTIAQTRRAALDERIYHEGRRAFAAGRGRDSCPYPDNTNARPWRAGHDDAQLDARLAA